MQEANRPHTQTHDMVATLLTASATTGWLGWIHGELWLFPSGLLRIPLNLLTTLLHSTGPTMDRTRPTQRVFDGATFHALIAARKNVWVPRESIQVAYLHRGIATDRLRLDVGNRHSVKLLWFPHDGAWQPLHAILTEWLGDNLIVD